MLCQCHMKHHILCNKNIQDSSFVMSNVFNFKKIWFKYQIAWFFFFYNIINKFSDWINVRLSWKMSALVDFRCKKIASEDSSHFFTFNFALFDSSIKIDDYSILVVIINDIVWLQISINESLRMKILNRKYDFKYYYNFFK